MKTKTILAVLSLAAFVHAAGPGGDSSGGGPGGNSGGGPGGESGGGPGGGGSFTYDDFISITTNANCVVRDGTLYGYTSSLTTSVAPTSSSTVSTLADGVFAGNTTITTVNLANTSITEIPTDCFAGCTALKTVTLPASCTTIGPSAFAGCTALTTFTGSGVTAVSHDAFRDCTALTTAAVATSATLPNEIGSYAYAQSGVTAADVSSVSTLGEGAFAGCESLTAATVATSATLPAALFAGCTALAVTDWSGVSSFGQAALAGIPATTLTVSSSATIGDYAFAADEATVATTLAQATLPSYGDTSFLGREMSYAPDGSSVARVEAMALVTWLQEQASDASSSVVQPTSYNTADLETWMETASNLSAVYAFCWAERYAEDSSFQPLTVDGATFLYTAPDSGTTDSLKVTVVGANSLTDEAGFTAEALEEAGTTDDVTSYVSADASAATCFARLRFTKGW